MRGHVSEQVKKERSARMRTLSDEMERHYVKRFCETVQPVLWEQVAGATEDGFINVGYTDNYIKVRGISPRSLVNHVTLARIMNVDDQGVHAVPIIV